MILLAVAAKAQNQTPVKNKNQKQAVIKKKPITAEEAKVIYEQKNGNTDADKRKSYSRKDIDESIPGEATVNNEIPNSADSSSVLIKTSPVINNQSQKQPKAIYKGPQKNSSGIDTKPNKPISTEPKFIEHIEIEIGSGNNDQ